MTALPQDAVADLQQRIAELERQLETAVHERDAAIERQTASALVNFRLKNELRAVTDRQKAGAEILDAIANTHGDAEHALQRIAETTQHFFNSASVTIRIAEGDQWIQTVRVGSSGHLTGAQPTSDSTAAGANLPATVYRQSRQIHIPDLDNVDPSMADWPVRTARAAGIRTVCATPLRRDGKALGALIVYRDRLAPFTDDELALQQSFADQAVIAIENARLFNETQEALARQTATADILRVISSSPTDVQPVFDAIVQTAVRLLGCETSFIQRCDGTHFWTVARCTKKEGPVPVFHSRRAAIDPGANFPSRAIVAKETLYLPDWSEIELPEFERRIQRELGYNSAIYLPLLREGECIGILGIAGSRPRMFSEADIALAKSFRDQAVIAIENTRLFSETQEALERQTATADILKVIASSPSDVQPVFDAIASSSKQLIGGFSATVFRFVDGIVNLAAYTPVSPAADKVLTASFPRPTANLPFFELAKGGEVVQEADSETNPDTGLRDIARARGFRSSLFSPLMSKGTPIGLIVVTRKEPGAFAAHHVQLLADLRRPGRDRDREHAAVQRDPGSAGAADRDRRHPEGDREFAVGRAAGVRGDRRQRGAAVRACSATITTLKDDKLHWNATAASIPGFDVERARTVYPTSVRPGTRTFGTRDPRTSYHRDSRYREPGYAGIYAQAPRAAGGFRSITFVPLIDQEQGIGTIIFTHPQAGYRFSEKQLALMQTFADQAVIAIENTRLFNETRRRRWSGRPRPPTS